MDTTEFSFLPFSYPKTVFYLESNYDVEINRYIQENYRQIVADFAEKRMGFLYLPVLLQEPEYRKILEYNYPFLNGKWDALSIADIYKEIARDMLWVVDETNVYRYGVKASNTAYYRSYNGSDLIVFDTVSERMNFIWKIEHDIDPNHLVHEFFLRFFEEYDFNFQRLPPKATDQKVAYQLFPILPKKGQEPPPKKKFRLVKPKENEEFDMEADILEKIERLKETGSMKLIGRIISELQKVNQHVSPLYITKEYRIYLKDYGMKEVVMAPLPKCLYILYLRHPEGIRFKKLCKHYDELLAIYREVTVHDDMDAAAESIRAMTDPLNNSINEKCSRIRAAFVELITDELAKNYYITGPRGERKKITLDRSLVEYDK